MTVTVLILLLAFQLKHLVADYYLQFPYMYLNKGQKTGWVRPLFDHALVHGIGTLMIAGAYIVWLTGSDGMLPFALAAFDMVTHFVTDRWKATRGRTPDQPKFWYDLGIDQMVHHVVSILIVYTLVTSCH
jgi:hypothetical protein